MAQPKPARKVPAEIVIPYAHLHPEVQKTITESLEEIKLRQSLKKTGLKYTAGAGAAIALGVINAVTGGSPELSGGLGLGGAVVALNTADVARENRAIEKQLQTPFNKKIISAINAYGPAANEHVEEHGLFHDPKATWNKLARDYRHVIVSKNGDVHVVKELPLIPRSEVSHAAIRKKPGVTA
jgi:hypothetical protein